MKFTLVKGLDNKFTLAFNSDLEKSKKLKAGVFFECEIKKKRNYMFHKKYFALINMVFDNQESYNNIDHLRHDITVEAGFYDKYINFQGVEVKKAKSVNFSNMDNIEFNELYNRSIDVIVKYFKFKKADILEHIEQYF